MSNAKILGWDYTKCMCCGGAEITIDGFTPPNGRSYFLATHLPGNFILDSNTHYPVSVLINWKADTASCSGQVIEVTRIARR